ncbi:MAG TPA: methionyl-tRNA formyltransferase [Thermomicrobiaceae bacterium]|nr:methionyl-tRNA formyltransferase [Thermomicrobiaceae bacterium]
MPDVVFFGSPEFAVPSLLALAHDPRFHVALVVTQPDRPAGRGRRLLPPPVKVAALERNLPVWQPATLRSPETEERLLALTPDLFVVVAYGEILRRRVLAIPRHGALNAHPSLLPEFRGASPIPAAILTGRDETGVSLIQLEARLDAGPIVAQQVVPLGGRETAGGLSERLAAVAAEMLPATAASWCAGEIVATLQHEAAASFTQRLDKQDGLLDWRSAANSLERRIRAMTPWPGAWTTLGGQRVIIEQAMLGGELLGVPPGGIATDAGHVLVRCGASSLELLRVRPAGRGSMAAAAWLRGLQAGGSHRFDALVGPALA